MMLTDVCNELDIPRPEVKIVPGKLLGTKLAACSSDGKELLLRRDLKIYELAMAISHECRHIWQYKTGKHSPPSAVDDYADSAANLKEYSRQECEIDANAYAQYICMQQLGITLDFGKLPQGVKDEINRRAKEFLLNGCEV